MIEIRLFGAIDVRIDGRPVDGLTFKQRLVLAVLALAEGTPVPREVLADRLWDGHPPHSWGSTLDSYVCVTRRALGVGSGSASPLATTANGFVLRAEVDLGWFHRLARVASDHHHRIALDWAWDALDLVTADPLAEVPYAAWAEAARARFRESFVSLGTESARRAIGLGDYAQAALLARAVVDREPVCESAWVQLMLAHWLAGDHAWALATYLSLKDTLEEHLGQDPGRGARELYVAILQSGPASGTGDPAHLRLLLRLLRSELEQMPGVRVPARDADLADCAVRQLTAPRPRGLVRQCHDLPHSTAASHTGRSGHEPGRPPVLDTRGGATCVV